MSIIFNSTDNLNEGLKVLINIGTNESKARAKIAELSSEHINNILLSDSDEQFQFLIFRLIFIVTIDFEGAKYFKEKCPQVERVINTIFSALGRAVVDDSDMGRIVIDILRYRYNLIKHNLIDHKR